MTKYYKKVRIVHGFGIFCENCGNLLETASEKDNLPEFGECNCDELEEREENE